ncbi:MAG: ABC transporter substrate-binding protein, partial [Chloroflexota bacterium]
MARALRLQLLLALAGSTIVAALVGILAYSSGVKTVPQEGGAYVEGLVGQPRTLDPLLTSSTDYPAQTIESLIFSGLVREDVSGQPQPDLAEHWTVSPNGRDYTFYLRPGVFWQDGKPFTSKDVAYTVKTIQSPGFPGNPDLAAAWQGVKVTTPDALTVEFRRPEVFAPFLDYATVGILPRHLLGSTPATELAASDFNQHPIGTGPYRLRNSGLRSALLEVSDRYYRAKPFLSRVLFRYYKDDQSAAQALLHGQIGADWLATPSDLRKVGTDQRLKLYQSVQPSFTGLSFNLSDPLIGRPEVRQAIAFAINRQAIIARQLDGEATKTSSPIPETSWAFDVSVKPYSYDPQKSASLLRAGGWQLGSNGMWMRDGKPLAPVILTDNRPDHLALANAITANLRSAGIAASVQAVGFDGLVKDFLAPRRFQVALLSWDLPGGDPDPYSLWHSSQATADGL